MMANSIPVAFETVGDPFSTLEATTRYWLADVDRVNERFGISADASGVADDWAFTGAYPNAALTVTGVLVDELWSTSGYVSALGAFSQWMVFWPGINKVSVSKPDGDPMPGTHLTGPASVSVTYREPWV